MRGDAGYTATEALAALAIVGLAIGGLQAGVRALVQSQDGVVRATVQSTETRSLDQALNAFLAPYGPFRRARPDVFTGAPDHFTFDCGTARCEAALADGALRLKGPAGERRVAMPGAKAPRFLYASDRASAELWPWAGSDVDREQLRSVSIVDEASGVSTPVAVARLWNQHEANCVFDSILQDCRQAGGS